MLSLFEAIRKNWASRVQILSSARIGRESQVAEKLVPYLVEMAPKAPMPLAKRVQHDFRYVALVNPDGPAVDRLNDTVWLPF